MRTAMRTTLALIAVVMFGVAFQAVSRPGPVAPVVEPHPAYWRRRESLEAKLFGRSCV